MPVECAVEARTRPTNGSEMRTTITTTRRAPRKKNGWKHIPPIQLNQIQSFTLDVLYARHPVWTADAFCAEREKNPFQFHLPKCVHGTALLLLLLVVTLTLPLQWHKWKRVAVTPHFGSSARTRFPFPVNFVRPNPPALLAHSWPCLDWFCLSRYAFQSLGTLPLPLNISSLFLSRYGNQCAWKERWMTMGGVIASFARQKGCINCRPSTRWARISCPAPSVLRRNCFWSLEFFVNNREQFEYLAEMAMTCGARAHVQQALPFEMA